MGERGAHVLVDQGVDGFVQTVRNIVGHLVSALWAEHYLRIGGINTRQDIFRPQGLLHWPQRVVQRQHVVWTTPSCQWQYGFTFQRSLRQQV
jgi:hypothetical protein